MAVTLRLARHGQKNRPYYRIVASEKGSKRDGRFIEVLGTYNPLVSPPQITLKEDKIRRWIAEGAQTTVLVRSLIAKSIPNLIEEKEKKKLDKIRAQRKARKQRNAASGKSGAAKKERAAKKEKAAKPAKKAASKKED